MGLARVRWSPSKVALTNGRDDGELKPAVEWIQARALQVSSTADLDPDSSAKCCK